MPNFLAAAFSMEVAVDSSSSIAIVAIPPVTSPPSGIFSPLLEVMA